MRKILGVAAFILACWLYGHADGSGFVIGSAQQGWISCTQATPCASSATTFFTTGGTTTLYRISASVNCTSATAAATAILTLKYTDPSSTIQTLTVPTATCTTLGSASLAFLLQSISVLNASNVQYSVAVVNSPNYQARIAVYQEGVN
jgi:hypothetical protein